MDARIALLGGFVVTVGNVQVPATQWRRRQAAAVVKVLALMARRTLHREQLIDRLWPESPVDEAAPRLHKAARYARRALGTANAVVLTGEMVSLLPDLDIEVDAIRFEAEGRAALAAGDPAAARAMVDRETAAVGVDDHCEFCSIMLAVPAAKACADVGDLEDARHHLVLAERSALRWEGTAWQAALLEVRAHIAAAEGEQDAAGALMQHAADLFEASGQPLHARRCRG